MNTVFETVSHYVAQDGLEPNIQLRLASNSWILLLQLPQCCGSRHVSTRLVVMAAPPLPPPPLSSPILLRFLESHYLSLVIWLTQNYRDFFQPLLLPFSDF